MPQKTTKHAHPFFKLIRWHLLYYDGIVTVLTRVEKTVTLFLLCLR